jgi:hypothetical protein
MTCDCPSPLRPIPAWSYRSLQLSLFDQQDLAEISHPDYPGERLIVGRNPLRAGKREDLLAATGKLAAPVLARVQAGGLAGAARIGVVLGKVIARSEVGKHFDVAITGRHDQIVQEAALDGIYVLGSSVAAAELDAPDTVAAYKNLARLECDFRHIKADDGPAPHLAPPRGTRQSFGVIPVGRSRRPSLGMPVLLFSPRYSISDFGSTGLA